MEGLLPSASCECWRALLLPRSSSRWCLSAAFRQVPGRSCSRPGSRWHSSHGPAPASDRALGLPPCTYIRTPAPTPPRPALTFTPAHSHPHSRPTPHLHPHPYSRPTPPRTPTPHTYIRTAASSAIYTQASRVRLPAPHPPPSTHKRPVPACPHRILTALITPPPSAWHQPPAAPNRTPDFPALATDSTIHAPTSSSRRPLLPAPKSPTKQILFLPASPAFSLEDASGLGWRGGGALSWEAWALFTW